ncbi:hypothetical protein NDA16_004501 [Ustilago loliicola]|nr:hypothetical protein NDA16_004501 [Ustilago loliicola]
MLDPSTLMQRIKEDKLTMESMNDRCRVLKRLLELAFDSRRRPDDDPDARQAVRLSFRAEFQGEGLALIQGHIVSHNELFRDAPTRRINPKPKLDRDEGTATDESALEAATSNPRLLRPKFYSKVLPFIQSSGFGKTRICVELSTVAPGLLVCLRKDGPNASFPPQDSSVYNYFAASSDSIEDKLAPLAGSAAREGSRRLRESPYAHHLSEPFSSMPLDVNFTKDHRERLFGRMPPDFTFKQLNLSLCSLGRPLWNDQIYSLQDKDEAFKGLLQPRAILTKLLCPADWKWPPVDPNLDLFEDDNQNLIALASQRFPLELSSSSGLERWHKFVGLQITQRLRFVGRIYSDTDAIDTSVPSEPPLSAAVAWLYRTGPASRIGPRWGMTVKAIIATRASIGLNFGAEGEEGFMLISAIAADVAAGMRYEEELRQGEDTADDRAPRSEDVYKAVMGLVTVKEWLDVLVGPEINDTTPPVRRSNPLRRSREEFEREDAGGLDKSSEMAADVIQGTAVNDFKQWSSRRWINFKHVVSLEESIRHEEVIDRSLLLELWLRHAAARGISNQEGWDLLIPTYQTDDEVPPDGDVCIDVNRLSYF